VTDNEERIDLVAMIRADRRHLETALAEGARVNAHHFVDAIVDNTRRLADLGVKDNGDGTFTVNGVSVGSPEVQPCGCPGAATVTIGRTKAEDTCVRCGRPA
jgi:hypothetical protein